MEIPQQRNPNEEDPLRMLKNSLNGYMMETEEGDAEVHELMLNLWLLLDMDTEDLSRGLVSDMLRGGISRIAKSHPGVRSEEVLDYMLDSVNGALANAELSTFTLKELRELAGEG